MEPRIWPILLTLNNMKNVNLKKERNLYLPFCLVHPKEIQDCWLQPSSGLELTCLAWIQYKFVCGLEYLTDQRRHPEKSCKTVQLKLLHIHQYCLSLISATVKNFWFYMSYFVSYLCKSLHKYLCVQKERPNFHQSESRTQRNNFHIGRKLIDCIVKFEKTFKIRSSLV